MTTDDVVDGPPREATVGELELVHAFTGPMPTGVSVSHSGRIFVNFPLWGDDVPATVVELRDGAEMPFPDERWNAPSGDDDAEAFVSVQSIVVDPADRLCVLDTGSPMFRPTKPGGPKLVCADLGSWETVVHDPRLLWPDTMSVAADQHLYVTANQLYRQTKYQGGEDRRHKPYALFRTSIGAGPVRLRR